MPKIKALKSFSYVVNASETRNIPAGWSGEIPAKAAKEHKKSLEILEKDKKSPPEVPAKPSDDDIAAALGDTIFKSLSLDEIGSDGVPNVNVLKGKLADYFGVAVPFDAETRNIAWSAYQEALQEENAKNDPDVKDAGV